MFSQIRRNACLVKEISIRHSKKIKSKPSLGGWLWNKNALNYLSKIDDKFMGIEVDVYVYWKLISNLSMLLICIDLFFNSYKKSSIKNIIYIRISLII